MGVLMAFHFDNFRQGEFFTIRGEVDDEAIASLFPGDYIFCPDEELDAHSQADRSSDENEDSSEQADSEQASSDANAEKNRLSFTANNISKD